ncbi:hypothetical protein CPB85DRAFT_1564822 [Mucidula mucida]|nr:hypothetical protein CPB85DRAFT_1564822 [Mucidula mucida]
MDSEAASFRAASLKAELDWERTTIRDIEGHRETLAARLDALATTKEYLSQRIADLGAPNALLLTQLEAAAQTAEDDSRVQTQRLLDLEAQLCTTLRDRDIMEKDMASARKVWDEKEAILLLKTDELRAKIISLDGDLDTTRAQSAIDRKLRVSAELGLQQEKTSRMRAAETVDGLNTRLKDALDEKQRLTTDLDRKVQSIRTGRAILAVARKKLCDVTSMRDALLGEVAAMNTTVDALRTQSATQTSQIQTLQRQLELANKRWSTHGQEIADEQLVWKDEDEVEAEKRQH